MANYELRNINQQSAGLSEPPEGPGPHELREPQVIIVKASDKTNNQASLPVDRYNLVFLILLIHGIGTLMPWNMFITAKAYFEDYKLNGTTHSEAEKEELDNLRKNFLSYLGQASQVPNVLFNGLNLLVNMGSGNLKLRVNVTLFLEAIIFAITIILAVVDSTEWPVAFFYLTMVSVVVLNMASGIYQNCIFGTGAKFPGTYTNAILIGSNVSGTFTSTVNLLSIWLAPKPQEAAIYYFLTAVFVILICIISYNLLPCNRFFNHFDKAILNTSPDQESTNDDSSRALVSSTQAEEIPEALRKTVDAMVPRPEDQGVKPTFVDELKEKWRVFCLCWPQCLNVFLTFYVTLALFPAIISNVGQSQSYFSDNYFTPFACFFIFNVFAMIGNLISGFTCWPGKQNVWILVVARALFVPFFLFCNFNAKSRHWPVYIKDDISFILANVLFGVSSGYLSSLCMMFASSDLKADEAPKAGMLAGFFLVFGIFLGVNSSLFLTWIVEL